MITADNITSHEFIGLNTEIVQSTNPQLIGLNGRIVDETKSMFTINTKWKNQLQNQQAVGSFQLTIKMLLLKVPKLQKDHLIE